MRSEKDEKSKIKSESYLTTNLACISTILMHFLLQELAYNPS